MFEDKSNTIENNFAFLSQNIYCKTHPKELAKSICIECKTFCCLKDSCGQKHIYHNIENLDYLLNNQIFPFITNFVDLSKNSDISTKIIYLNTYKKNLKNFAVEEKRKTDEYYKKILNELNNIYNRYMEGINQFIESLTYKFDVLYSKLNKINDSEMSQIDNYLNFTLRDTKGNSEAFIIAVSKEIKTLCNKINEIKKKTVSLDFESEVKDIKNFAEKEYNKVNNIEYFSNLNNILHKDLQELISRSDRCSISKIKRMVSVGSTVHNIDTDIFVRDLADLVNRLRLEPSDTLKLLKDYIGEDVNDTISYDLNTTNRFQNIFDNVMKLSQNRISLPPLDWDNDLSNSAEDYLAQTEGKIERDNDFHNHMKEFILNYYDKHNHIKSFYYVGFPRIEKIIIKILIESDFLFDSKYNEIGICAINSPYKDNHVVLVINLSYLNK